MTNPIGLFKQIFASGAPAMGERPAGEVDALRCQAVDEELSAERQLKDLKAADLASFTDDQLQRHQTALATAALVLKRATDRRIALERACREATARETRAETIALTKNAAERLHGAITAERAASVAASQARLALEVLCTEVRSAFRAVGECSLWDAIDCSPETLDDIDRLLRQALQTLGRETSAQMIPRDPRPAEGATRTYHGDAPHGRDEVFRSGRWVPDHTGPRVLG